MVTRREFLKTMAGAAITTLAAPLLAMPRAYAAEAEKKYEFPWPYTKLDVEETLKRGYLGYYVFHCGGGAFWAVASQLQEKIGDVWSVLPVPSFEEVRTAALQKKHLATLMQFGFGGAVSYAVLCGALNGSLFLLQVIIDLEKVYKVLGRILLRTYEIFPFPSEIVNRLAVEGKLYIPKDKMKFSGWLPASRSDSVLCHVSVSKWCMVSGYASGSKERSERCGRLTADVAAMNAVLLNAFWDAASELGFVKGYKFDAKSAKGSESKILAKIKEKLNEYASAGGIAGYYAKWLLKGYKLSATTASCRTCHYKGQDYEMGQFTRGFMECEACHKDMTPHAHYMIQMPQTLTHHEASVREFNATLPLLTGVMGVLAGIAAGVGVSKKQK